VREYVCVRICVCVCVYVCENVLPLIYRCCRWLVSWICVCAYLCLCVCVCVWECLTTDLPLLPLTRVVWLPFIPEGQDDSVTHVSCVTWLFHVGYTSLSRALWLILCERTTISGRLRHACLIHIIDETFSCMIQVITKCDMTHSYANELPFRDDCVTRVLFICVTLLLHVWYKSLSRVTDSFICKRKSSQNGSSRIWPAHVFDVTFFIFDISHYHVCYDSLICKRTTTSRRLRHTWLVHM